MSQERDDQGMRKLFQAQREAEAAAAPDYARLTRSTVAGSKEAIRPRRALGLATLSAAATLTLVLAATWLGLKTPETISRSADVAIPPGKEVVSAPRPSLELQSRATAVGDKVAAGVEAVGPTGQSITAGAAVEQGRDALTPEVRRQLESLEYVGSNEQRSNARTEIAQASEADRIPRDGEGRGDGTATRPVAEAAAQKADERSKASPVRPTDEFVQDLAVPGRFQQNGGAIAPPPPPSPSSASSRVNANSIGEMGVITSGGGIDQPRPLVAAARLVAPPMEDQGSESYQPIRDNEFLSAKDHPLSTFSIDVDTASYANVRRYLSQGLWPPRDAVRIEELINYFRYDYPQPTGDAPFSATVEIADCPWRPEHRLARIGLKGRESSSADRRGSNLVFLIDVSGSMSQPQKLPLLKSALALLLEQLDGRDQVAMVTYAGASGLVLPPTPGSAKAEIRRALDRLEAGGSTNGGEGLRLAYRIAREQFIEGGVNRVVLATDGDFNVGVTSRGDLLRLIEDDAKAGVFLTVLGFGMGNIKDDTLELLADRGNGNYAYIDGLREARKVLVEEAGGTLITIAKDVKIQVEFNPLEVSAYRLIGYENRMLRQEEFNDDRKDAGEIGAGHTVTALFEIVPAATPPALPEVDPLRYQTQAAAAEAATSGEWLTLKLRYKEPAGAKSRLLSFPVRDEGLGLRAASADFKFASAVALFGMVLRGSVDADVAYERIEGLAAEGAARDAGGYRAEFHELISRARALSPRPSPGPRP